MRIIALASFAGLSLAASACTGGAADAPARGTLAYVDPGGQVRLLDLAGGDDVPTGASGVALALSPDAQHVAFHDMTGALSFADRAGGITAITPSGSCFSGAWPATSIFTYCLATSSYQGGAVISAPGATPRLLPQSFAVSPDGTVDVTLTGSGDSILENVDGTSPRVLAPGSAALGTPELISPDGSTAILADDAVFPTGVQLVHLADGAHIAVSDAFFPGSNIGAPQIVGASMFSPDGSEILLQSSTALVAVSLATGSKRTIAPLSAKIACAAAAFLDAERVLWVRYDDHSDGDIGHGFLSLHLASAGSDVTLSDPQIDNQTWPAIAVTADHTIALPSTDLLVTADGDVVGANATDDPVVSFAGVTPTNGIIAITAAGAVTLLATDGSSRALVQSAGDPRNAFGPAVAYVQASLAAD